MVFSGKSLGLGAEGLCYNSCLSAPLWVTHLKILGLKFFILKKKNSGHKIKVVSRIDQFKTHSIFVIFLVLSILIQNQMLLSLGRSISHYYKANAKCDALE